MEINFDPGFINHISAFVPNIEYMYGSLNRYSNFNQKKMQFRMYYPKLQAFIKNYVSFYLGCMLWAEYISTIKGEDVLNNLCFGGEYNEAESLEEVEYVKNYLDKFKKDVKYYLGKTEEIDERYIKIIDAYREFLKVNEGFVKLKKTDDVKLPDCLKKIDDIEGIKSKIDDVIETGRLFELLEYTDKVL